MRKVHRKICFCCGSLFYSRSILSKHCSRKCSNKYFRSKNQPSQADLKRQFEAQNETNTPNTYNIAEAA